MDLNSSQLSDNLLNFDILIDVTDATDKCSLQLRFITEHLSEQRLPYLCVKLELSYSVGLDFQFISSGSIITMKLLKVKEHLTINYEYINVDDIVNQLPQSTNLISFSYILNCTNEDVTAIAVSPEEKEQSWKRIQSLLEL